MRVRCATLGLLLTAACSSGSLQPVPDSGAFCTAVRARPSPDAGFFPYGHSHNDYEQPRPLLDALDLRFYSVEADLWLQGDQIIVSHTAFSSRGTLKALYLDPLQKRVDQLGSVYGDGQPFILWLELKAGGTELEEALKVQLAPYSMFTVFDGTRTRVGPVTAVLTGDDAAKKAYVAPDGPRKACRDGDYAIDDPPADERWSYEALSWGSFFTWDGKGTIPPAELARLGCLVEDIHRKGRKVRLYAAPETPEYFEAAISVEVDLIGADGLKGLHDFLQKVQ